MCVTESASTHSFAVAEQAGERLDRALQSAAPELSRTATQRLIEAGGVRVDGRPGKSGQRLRAGEQVEWTAPEARPPPSSLRGEPIPLDVRYEDADLLVIDKPRGLVVHPAPGHHTGTLVHALLAHAAEEPPAAGREERPGIVHRLDKDTSGLLMVARTERAYLALQAQIQSRAAERRYLALVRGGPRFERAAVDAPVGRQPTDRKRMAVIAPGSAHAHREARTDLRVLERFTGFALLEARLHTGRTHQVRVHCAYIQLPVVGDATYGPRRVERDPLLHPAVRAALLDLGGQALHAYRLAFDHPATGERMQFLSQPPPDFAALLRALESTWSARETDPWPEE